MTRGHGRKFPPGSGAGKGSFPYPYHADPRGGCQTPGGGLLLFGYKGRLYCITPPSVA